MTDGTDWMQGIGNVVQAVCAVVATCASVVIAIAAHKFQSGQIRPFLALDVSNQTHGTRVLLQNQGLGPAKLGKVTYRYRDERADRVDDQQLREKHCISSLTGLPSGLHRVYMMRAKEVDAAITPQEETRLQHLRQYLDVSSSKNCVETSVVAGQVLGAGGKELELFCVKVKDTPEAKQWLQRARNMLNGITVEVEYQDARGFIIQPNFQGTITMPKHPQLVKHLWQKAFREISAPKQQASATRWSLLSIVASILGNKDSSAGPIEVRPIAQEPAAHLASDDLGGVTLHELRSISMV